MTTTLPHNIPEFNITNLDEDWKLATVYTAFLSPKTPQQAVKLIYHENTRGVSENWVITARRKLIDMGYITKVDDEVLNTLYISDTGPVVNLILSHQNSSFFTQKGAETVIKSLSVFLNSQWFRTFFKEDFFYSPIMYSDMTVYGPYADMYIRTPSGLNQKMEITNLSQRMSHLLYDIGYYSHNLRWQLLYERQEVRNLRDPEMELLEEIILTDDFDLFVEHNREKIPPNLSLLICSILKKITKENCYGKAPLQLFQKLLQSGTGYFLPNFFSMMFRHMSRLPSTEDSLDFGFLRKEMFNLSHSGDLKKIDPNCITQYLSGAQLGKENL